MQATHLIYDPGTDDGAAAVIDGLVDSREKIYFEYGNDDGQSLGFKHALEGFVVQAAGYPYLQLRRGAPSSDPLKTVDLVAIRKSSGPLLWKADNYKPPYDWKRPKTYLNGTAQLFLKPNFEGEQLNSEGLALVITFGTEGQLNRWMEKQRKLDS